MELVVAIALFAIIVPSLYFALESSMRINLYSDTDSDATLLAQAELERINAIGHSSTLENTFSAYTCNVDYTLCTLTVGDVLYEAEITTLNTSTAIDSVLLHVTKKDVTASLQLFINFGD